MPSCSVTIVTQARLGHSTVAVTMNIYSHVLPSMDRDATDKIESVLAVDPAEKKQVK